MRIVNLVENTEGTSGCAAEHGLSFYIETEKHRLLMDTGASDLFIENAGKLGVDLKQVDTVVLSHGHYDHAGGIIPFSRINDKAKIYVHQQAFAECYSTTRGGEPRYIGVDPEIKKLPQLIMGGCEGTKSQGEKLPQLIMGGFEGTKSQGEKLPQPITEGFVDTKSKKKEIPSLITGSFKIDEELELFSDIGYTKPSPLTNKTLYVMKNGKLVNDDFTHEQCLVISQNGKRYVFSGCAHHGVLNILERYKQIYEDVPDVIFTGFHTLRKHGYSEEDVDYIKKTATELKKIRTKVYTMHCTGEEPYEMMREIMGEQIEYVHSGDEIALK
ncbi:MBL fold metallo-hydrolase [Butyrivibrio sp. JL13D10]|uniref:MBL fold metallo-hydrolase n=1 Tax=Butyrivibrio sp. JL13D10 TaxID=3236815 RepID=UPI0038B55954